MSLTLESFLKQDALPEYKFTTSPANARKETTQKSGSLTTPALPDNASTTQIWAHRHLMSAKLGEIEWTPRLESWEQFQEAIKKDISQLDIKVQEAPFVFPRSEADVGIMMENIILNPLWQIAKALWLPDPSTNEKTKQFNFTLEVLSEAYTRQRKAAKTLELKSAAPEAPTIVGVSKGTPSTTASTKSSTSTMVTDASRATSAQRAGTKTSTKGKEGSVADKMKDAHTAPGQSTNQTNQSDKAQKPDKDLPGVRVDRIYSLLLEEAPTPIPTFEGAMTRGRTAKQQEKRDAAHIDSTNDYLPRGHIWRIDTPVSTDAQSKPLDDKHLRALFPVELKRMTYIDETQLAELRGKRIWSKSFDGMPAYVSQTLRYADYYGTQYAVLTDGNNAIILVLPDGDLSGGTIECRLVKKHEIRLYIAYLLWLSLGDVERRLTQNQGSDAERETKTVTAHPVETTKGNRGPGTNAAARGSSVGRSQSRARKT